MGNQFWQKIVDKKDPCIIAEIGTNHNGDLDIAKKLVEAAAIAGADCVKFQIYESQEIVSRNVRAKDYGLHELYGDIAAEEMFDKFLKTPKSWFPELSDHSRKLGLGLGVTIHGEAGLNWAQGVAPDFLKVASMDHNNLPLLSQITEKADIPILVSFGMAELTDIQMAMDILTAYEWGVGIFHCVAIYPPKKEDLRLKNIQYMAGKYNVPVGFSDHTSDVTSAPLAMALGATFFEKHLTLDCKQGGPDHPFALEPNKFKEYIRALKSTSIIIGKEAFSPPSEEELEKRKHYMKSIILSKDLPKGHKIVEGDFYIARPGTGIPPKEENMVIGSKLNTSKEAHTVLVWQDIELTK